MLPVQFHMIWIKSRQVFTPIYAVPVLSGNPVVSGYTVKYSNHTVMKMHLKLHKNGKRACLVIICPLFPSAY